MLTASACSGDLSNMAYEHPCRIKYSFIQVAETHTLFHRRSFSLFQSLVGRRPTRQGSEKNHLHPHEGTDQIESKCKDPTRLGSPKILTCLLYLVSKRFHLKAPTLSFWKKISQQNFHPNGEIVGKHGFSIARCLFVAWAASLFQSNSRLLLFINGITFTFSFCIFVFDILRDMPDT